MTFLLLYNCISLIFNASSETCSSCTEIGDSLLLHETTLLLPKFMKTLIVGCSVTACFNQIHTSYINT